MAKGGMRFTRHYSGSTVCAPSRCVLMTGLHTGHARIRDGPGQLQPGDLSFAKVLQKRLPNRLLRQVGHRQSAAAGRPTAPRLRRVLRLHQHVPRAQFLPEFLVHNGSKLKLRNVLYDDWRARRIGPQYEGAGVAKVAVDYAPKMIADRLMDYIRNAGADKSKPFSPTTLSTSLTPTTRPAGKTDRVRRHARAGLGQSREPRHPRSGKRLRPDDRLHRPGRGANSDHPQGTQNRRQHHRDVFERQRPASGGATQDGILRQ